VPTRRDNPGYDFLLTMPDGATADLSLKSYGISYHEASFRQEASKTEEVFLSLLRERGSLGAVLMASEHLSRLDRLECAAHHARRLAA